MEAQSKLPTFFFTVLFVSIEGHNYKHLKIERRYETLLTAHLCSDLYFYFYFCFV